ncbi:MAG: cytochrome c biogenesis protein CcdA [Bryobacterales bacterium]
MVLKKQFFVLLPILAALAATAALAQTGSRKPALDPVQLTFELRPATAAPGGRVIGHLTARIEEGWHIYSANSPVRQIATRVTLEQHPAVASWKVYQPKPLLKFDAYTQQDGELYENEAIFLIEAELSAAELGASAEASEIVATVRYSACDDRLCLPPRSKSATATLSVAAGASLTAAPIPAGYSDVTPAAGMAAENAAAETPAAGGAAAQRGASPSGEEPRNLSGRPGDEGLLRFAMVALGFGVLAIFTPCVFPMIPITMSYFISTQGDAPRASLSQALTFCAGVVVLFTGLGAAVSAILGPFGIVQLGSNVWVNLFIALVFILFAASLLGAFEITVPSSVLTKLNKASGRGDLLGTLIMGLVFALASFACTGPFVGALLAGSIQGNLAWPIFGMLMFSIGLALPFFFLALFPAYLKRMPRSGGWLATTKITMGFLILAAAVKYLSNVDQMYQWWILTRERFLAIWIVLLFLAGFYLLGFLRLGDAGESGQQQAIGVGRLSVAAALLAIALGLFPGMFGGRLGDLDAYVPSPEYSGLAGVFSGGEGSQQSKWLKNDYEGALALARSSGKNILLSFTGYACTNCHWMKANMFPRPEIAAVVGDLVVVELYTDGVDEASRKNQQLQLDRFGTVAIPYYAVIRPDETIVAEFAGRTPDAGEFLAFLTTGEPAGGGELSAADVLQ